MRKWIVLVALAVAAFAAAADVSEACGRRRGRHRACYQPCYSWTPCTPAVLGPGWAPQAPPGYQVPPSAGARSVTIKGRTYQLLPTGDRGENDREVVESIEGGFGKGSDIPSQDMFAGKVRRIAKTNILDGQPRAFASVGALREFLPKDPAMAKLGIGKDPASDRVEQEKLNVTLTAYIYAFRKESDNDYHVIMGDAPNTPNPRYVNAEVSGIPNAGTDDNRNQLWAVRKAFQQAFQLGDQGPDAYFRPHQPVPVHITGSLFWDVEHYPQTVGPRDFAPKTAWEIHPISEIEFLN